MRTYGQVFAKICVDEICKADRRTNPMDEDERWKTATAMVKSYPFLLADELVDFVDKLSNAQVPVRRAGQDEYGMFAITRTAIMERLGAYVRNFRPMTTETTDSDFGLQKVRVPLGARTDYEKTHDMDGTPMPAGWNADAYWQNVKRTHNYDFSKHEYVYVGDRYLEDAIAWWEAKPHPVEIADIGSVQQAADSLAFQLAAV